MQSDPDDVTRPRLYSANLTYLKFNLSFNGKNCNSRMVITAFGDSLYRAVDVVNLSTENEVKKPSQTFAYLAKRYPLLLHKDRMLLDYIQVKSLKWFYNKCFCLTSTL